MEHFLEAWVEHGIAFFCKGIGYPHRRVGLNVAAHADVAACFRQILEQADRHACGCRRTEARCTVGECRNIMECHIADIGENLLPKL